MDTGNVQPAIQAPAGARQTLRQPAEVIVRRKAGTGNAHSNPLTGLDADDALHKLEVHQIELEMEIDELRRGQRALDSARARYFDFSLFTIWRRWATARSAPEA